MKKKLINAYENFGLSVQGPSLAKAVHPHCHQSHYVQKTTVMLKRCIIRGIHRLW